MSIYKVSNIGRPDGPMILAVDYCLAGMWHGFSNIESDFGYRFRTFWHGETTF